MVQNLLGHSLRDGCLIFDWLVVLRENHETEFPVSEKMDADPNSVLSPEQIQPSCKRGREVASPRKWNLLDERPKIPYGVWLY